MKLILLSILTAFFFSNAQAQTPKNPNPVAGASAGARVSPDQYQLGNTLVSVPAPPGFEEATSQLDAIKRFFEATEDKNLDLLAVHLPAEVVARIKRGETPELGIYTKVSVSKSLRVRDVTQKEFSDFVSNFRTNFNQVLDINSPHMKSILKSASEGLTKVLEQEAKLNLTQPVNLGTIEDSPNVFSLLLMTKVRFQSGARAEERLQLGSLAMVKAKRKILFVYTYKPFKAPEDADALKKFTKDWLQQIQKAN